MVPSAELDAHLHDKAAEIARSRHSSKTRYVFVTVLVKWLPAACFEGGRLLYVYVQGIRWFVTGQPSP